MRKSSSDAYIIATWKQVSPLPPGPITACFFMMVSVWADLFHLCFGFILIVAGRMMTVMSEFYGAEAFVPYGPKTITNLRSGFRSENKEYDIGETIAYFAELQKKDPEFFYRISFDEENRVENIFWVDNVAIKTYADAYHDCVSFDTTFMTNHFNMPFAPFIGINRHGQSFMLGCGFLRDEKEDSFKWLFACFLKQCMAGIRQISLQIRTGQ